MSPFDSRVCRAIRGNWEAVAIADCSDIIVADFLPARRGWTYDAEKDLFYVAATHKNGKRGIAQISFSERKAEFLSQLIGTRTPASLGYGEEVNLSEVFFPAIEEYVFYSAAQKLLYFRSQDYFFVMNHERKIRKIFGNGTADRDLVSVAMIKPSEVVMPLLNSTSTHPFHVLDDGRILMTAEKRTGAREGSGFGQLFVIEGLDVNNPEKKVTLLNLWGTDQRQMYRSYLYMPQQKVLHGVTAWGGVETIGVPTAMADLNLLEEQVDLYTFSPGILQRGSVAVTPMSSFIKEELAQTTPASLPRKFYAFVQDMALGNANYLYFSDSISGFLLALDLRTNRIEPVIGYVDQLGEDDFGMNRRVDLPHGLGKDHNGNLIFSDRKGVHRAVRDQESGTYSVSTIDEKLAEGRAFASPDGRHYIRFAGLAEFEIYDLLRAGRQIPAKFKYQRTFTGINYLIQIGLHFLQDGRIALYDWQSSWDSFRVRESALTHTILPKLANWNGSTLATTGALLSHPDTISNDYPRASKKSDCWDPSPAPPYSQGVLRSDDAILAKDFRLCAYSNGTRGNVGVATFVDANTIVSCSQHLQYRAGAKSVVIIDIAAGTTAFKPVNCDPTASQFLMHRGQLIHGIQNRIETIDMNTWTTSALPLVSPLQTNMVIQSLLVDDSHVYFADKQSDRVLRIARVTKNN